MDVKPVTVVNAVFEAPHCTLYVTAPVTAPHPNVALLVVMEEIFNPDGIAQPPVVVKSVDAVKDDVEVAEQTVCTCHS